MASEIILLFREKIEEKNLERNCQILCKALLSIMEISMFMFLNCVTYPTLVIDVHNIGDTIYECFV